MTFDFEKDLALALKNGGFIEATDPDLAKFKARGGKLLLYHGWADPGPAPENTINYYDAVNRKLGSRQDDWMRLFLMPGVGHCGGGVGPDQADFLGAIERWREGGVAPNDIVSLLAATLILASCAVLASYLPARRASRADPAETLRAE